VLRSIHPFTTLSFVLLSFVVAIAGKRPAQIALGLTFLVISVLIEKKGQLWKKVLLYVLPISCLLVFVNRLFGATTEEGLNYAIRFALLVTPMLILVYSTPARKLSLALRTVNVPPRLQYLFLFSFEMVSMLRNLLHNVRIAQQLRGLRFEQTFVRRWRNIFPLLFPVLLIAISQGLDRSLAIEFKGIEYRGPKTYLRTLPWSRTDKFLASALLISSCGVILSRVL
jgi:energy-coupling factor transporter transmembrane protein EcfT